MHIIVPFFMLLGQLRVLALMAVTMAMNENNFRGSCNHFV